MFPHTVPRTFQPSAQRHRESFESLRTTRNYLIASGVTPVSQAAPGTAIVIDLTGDDDETAPWGGGPATSPDSGHLYRPRFSLPGAPDGSSAEPLIRSASQSSDTATSNASSPQDATTPPTPPPMPEWKRNFRSKSRAWMGKTTMPPAVINALSLEKQYAKPANGSSIISYNDYQTDFDPNYTLKAKDAAARAESHRKKQLGKEDREKRLAVQKEKREKAALRRKEQRKKHEESVRVEKKTREECAAQEQRAAEEEEAEAETQVVAEELAAEMQKLAEQEKQAAREERTPAEKKAVQKRRRDNEEETSFAATDDSTPRKRHGTSKKLHLIAQKSDTAKKLTASAMNAEHLEKAQHETRGQMGHSETQPQKLPRETPQQADEHGSPPARQSSTDTEEVELDSVIPLDDDDDDDDDLFGEVAQKKQQWEEVKARFRRQLADEEAAQLRALRNPRKTTEKADAKTKAQEEKEECERQCRELREQLAMKDKKSDSQKHAATPAAAKPGRC